MGRTLDGARESRQSVRPRFRHGNRDPAFRDSDDLAGLQRSNRLLDRHGLARRSHGSLFLLNDRIRTLADVWRRRFRERFFRIDLADAGGSGFSGAAIAAFSGSTDVRSSGIAGLATGSAGASADVAPAAVFAVSAGLVSGAT